jgi:putative ABC transport system permease protein
MTQAVVTAPVLSPVALALAAALLLLNVAVSWGFRLGLEKKLALAAVRMVVQLALAGAVLSLIFAQSSPVWTAAMALVMAAAAGHEVVSRQKRRPAGAMPYLAGTATLLFVGTVFATLAVGGLIGAEPWYAPRFLLPVLGMVLGNAMTGVSLVLDTITGAAERERNVIEARLAQGATRFEAFDGVLRRGIETGLMPILNAMAVAGVVSLPGMMTGQILAGSDPMEAAKYQMMILFVIAGATALSVLIAGFAAVWLLTDERHRLRLDRLAAAPGV